MSFSWQYLHNDPLTPVGLVTGSPLFTWKNYANEFSEDFFVHATVDPPELGFTIYVQVSATPDFAVIIAEELALNLVDNWNGTSQYQSTMVLPTGATLYWRLKTVDNMGSFPEPLYSTTDNTWWEGGAWVTHPGYTGYQVISTGSSATSTTTSSSTTSTSSTTLSSTTSSTSSSSTTSSSTTSTLSSTTSSTSSVSTTSSSTTLTLSSTTSSTSSSSTTSSTTSSSSTSSSTTTLCPMRMNFMPSRKESAFYRRKNDERVELMGMPCKVYRAKDGATRTVNEFDRIIISKPMVEPKPVDTFVIVEPYQVEKSRIGDDKATEHVDFPFTVTLKFADDIKRLDLIEIPYEYARAAGLMRCLNDSAVKTPTRTLYTRFKIVNRLTRGINSDLTNKYFISPTEEVWRV